MTPEYLEKNPRPTQPLLTDEDWQAISDETERIIPGRVIAVIQKHIAAKLACGVAIPLKAQE